MLFAIDGRKMISDYLPKIIITSKKAWTLSHFKNNLNYALT